MKEKLKNPVWYSLSETHKNFLIEYDGVKFYNPKICSFGSFLDESDTYNALNKYAELTDTFFLVSENKTPTFENEKIILKKKFEGCQMVLKSTSEIENSEEIIPLTNNNINEVYNLIHLVMPSFYRKGGFNMGNYFGIYKNKKLVSIAGMRMQSDDFIEVSGVVTHPDHVKRGYAKQLSNHVTKEIIKQGKKPILHTTKGNPAIKLYQKLGYKITRDMNWWLFAKK